MSQLAKEFVFGLRNTGASRVSVEEIDSRCCFYSLLSLRSNGQLVQTNSCGAISGLFLKYLTENGAREIGHRCKETDVKQDMWIAFVAREYITRILVGYDDEQASAIEIHTNLHRHTLGDIYLSPYISDLDFSDQDLAIIGFSPTFSPDLLIELSIYTAPVTLNTSILPHTKIDPEGISPALITEAYYDSRKRELDMREDKARIVICFSSTKAMHRANTLKDEEELNCSIRPDE